MRFCELCEIHLERKVIVPKTFRTIHNKHISIQVNVTYFIRKSIHTHIRVPMNAASTHRIANRTENQPNNGIVHTQMTKRKQIGIVWIIGGIGPAYSHNTYYKFEYVFGFVLCCFTFGAGATLCWLCSLRNSPVICFVVISENRIPSQVYLCLCECVWVPNAVNKFCVVGRFASFIYFLGINFFPFIRSFFFCYFFFCSSSSYSCYL